MFFLIGICVGSFFNQLIVGDVWRRSRCDHCHIPLPWYTLIPIFSYLCLLGKCHHCKQKIAMSYVLMELFCGVFFMLCGYLFQGDVLIKRLFIGMILILNARHDMIKQEIKIRYIVLGMIGSIYFEQLHYIVSAITVVWILMMFRLVFEWVYNQEGMGFGDVLVYLVLSLSFPFEFIILNLLMASLLGIMYMLIKKTTRIPFVPMILIAYIIQLLSVTMC